MSLKSKFISGALWSIVGQVLYFLLVFVSNIWMTRLLTPQDFGQFGIIMFFITLSNVLIESGLGGALVRKTEVKQIEYSTVFVANLILSVFCFLGLYLCSSLIAQYYGDFKLKDLLLVSSVILLINAFQFTQTARLTVEMRFKERYLFRVVSVFFGAICGIGMAYYGLGVWSLIGLQISSVLINTVLLWKVYGASLNFNFSLSVFKELYGFGVNTTISSLIRTGFDNIYQLILGRYFSISETGFYYQAKKLQEVPGSIITMLSQNVVFSTLAKIQNDLSRFVRVYSLITKCFLITFGLIVVLLYTFSEPIILLFYGEEWLGSIFYMKLLSIASFFYMQENINRIIFKVYNETRKLLWLEIFKKVIQSVSIGFGIFYKSLELLIWGYVVTNAIGYFVNYFSSRKIISAAVKIEIVNLIKVCLAIIITIFTTEFTINYLSIFGYYKLLFIPFSLTIFLVFIMVLQVFRSINELKTILENIRR